MKKNFKEWIFDLKNSIICPEFTTIGIMIIYPGLGIFITYFIGGSLNFKDIMYNVIFALIPFILGYKVSKKIFENSEVLILLVLSSFMIFSGITLKSDAIKFDFPDICYIIAFIICVLWTIIDLKEFNQARKRRKDYKLNKKMSSNQSKSNYIDDMEVE